MRGVHVHETDTDISVFCVRHYQAALKVAREKKVSG
jgi:hypothetical protein